MNDILDLHTHTVASGHAYNTLYEMARSAAEKGLKLFGSSDHAPAMPGSTHEYYFINFTVIPRRLFGVTVIMGSELNILDYKGTVDLREPILRKLDYTIASIHDPCYQRGSVAENTNAYLGAIKNPYVNIIGHPDDERFPIDFDTLAAAASQHNKLLEVNNSSLGPKTSRKGAHGNYVRLLECCKRYHTHIIVNSDAHMEPDVGNHRYARRLLEEIDFPETLVVNSSIERLSPFIPSLAGIFSSTDDK